MIPGGVRLIRIERSPKSTLLQLQIDRELAVRLGWRIGAAVLPVIDHEAGIVGFRLAGDGYPLAPFYQGIDECEGLYMRCQARMTMTPTNADLFLQTAERDCQPEVIEGVLIIGEAMIPQTSIDETKQAVARSNQGVDGSERRAISTRSEGGPNT